MADQAIHLYMSYKLIGLNIRFRTPNIFFMIICVWFQLDMFDFPIFWSSVLVLVPALIGFIERHESWADRPIGSSFIHRSLIFFQFVTVGVPKRQGEVTWLPESQELLLLATMPGITNSWANSSSISNAPVLPGA